LHDVRKSNHTLVQNLWLIAYSTQTAHFTCPNGKAFFSSSIVWGKWM
jgi:hypothetical protein